MNTNNKSDLTITDYFKLFLQEFLEILIAYIVYSLLIEQNLFSIKAVKISAILAAVSVALEYYNPVLKGHVKSGLFSGIGSNILKNV